MNITNFQNIHPCLAEAILSARLCLASLPDIIIIIIIYIIISISLPDIIIIIIINIII